MSCLTTTTDRDTPAISAIRAAVFGRADHLGREEALILLASSNYPNRIRDIESIIVDADQPSDLRALAAIWLGRIVHPSTACALLRQLSIDEPQVQHHIVRQLGMVGDAAAIEPLLASSQSKSGAARSRTRFAAGLIQHRFQHEASAITLHKRVKALQPDDCATASVAINRLTRGHVEKCLMDIAIDPLGVVLNEDSALEICIDLDKWMLLLNAALVDESMVLKIESHTSVFGILAEWDQLGKSYFLSGIILSSPDSSTGVPRLHLHDMDGALLALGQAPCTIRSNRFNLKTVTDYAGIAFNFEAALNKGCPFGLQGQAALIDTRKQVAATL